MVTHLSQTPFKSMGLHKNLIKALDALNYEFATPIQAEAIPLLLDGKDVAGQAQTGTGKTNAFLLGVLNELLHVQAHLFDLLWTIPSRSACCETHS